MTATADPRALHIPHPRARATSVVYAIAHAGAGAAPWNEVAAAMPDAVELRALRLPGRENRFRTPAHTSMASAVDELRGIVQRDAADHGKPVVLVGSCSGALVAVAVAGVLALPVAGLVVVRQPVPDNIDSADGLASMSSEALRQWVHERRITPGALLDSGMFEFFEPVLRADLSVVEGYRYTGPLRHMPVHLVHCSWGGAEPQPEAWRRVTDGSVERTYLDVEGDPLAEHPAELAAAIIRLTTDVPPAYSSSDSAISGQDT